jgi:Protein of unknown function (DUF3892)
MAQKIEIESISKSEEESNTGRITHIGGTNHCRPWRMTQEKAIEYIENGTYLFFIVKEYAKMDVVIATDSDKNKYLKSFADGTTPDNLLKLKECPVN